MSLPADPLYPRDDRTLPCEQEAPPAPRRPRAHRVRRATAAGLLATIVVSAALLLHHVFLDRTNVPALESFLRFQPPTTGEVYDRRGELLLQIAREYREVLRYEDLPPVLEAAILAAEDRRFFQHDGIDYQAWPRVAWKAASHTAEASWRASRRAGLPRLRVVLPQGGSSLTQQLVRGYFLRGLTSLEDDNVLLRDTTSTRLLSLVFGVPSTNRLVRKVEEARLALWLEEEMTRRFGKQRAKEEILARYASFVYLGEGRYGFAAASAFYFGRPISDLHPGRVAEAALLAGITKSPAEYAPRPGHLSRPRARRDQVLALMAENGWFPPDAAERAQAVPVAVVPRAEVKTAAPSVIQAVFEELAAPDLPRGLVPELVSGHIRVETTVDAGVQRIVNEALEAGLLAYEKRRPRGRGIVQGSVVVLRNSDAAVLAEAGGRASVRDRPTRYSDLNRVRQSLRQPGSALKPFVYLAGLRQRHFGLGTYVPDEPIGIETPQGATKWIANYDGVYKGYIPVRQAIAESRNTVAVWIAQQIGMPAVLRTIRDMGIRTPMSPGEPTVLGASEVTLLELANGYRALASGLVAEPHAISRVRDADGAVVFARDGRPRRLDRRYPLAAIQEALRGVVRLPSGTAHALAAEEFGIPVMGKTGTTSDFRDAIFVGSTWGPAGVTVAVRVGFDDNRGLGSRETGGRVALPIFREIVKRIYAESLVGEAPEFPRALEDRIDAYLIENGLPGAIVRPDDPLRAAMPLPMGRPRPSLFKTSLAGPPG
jgi:penicillin-binding protein 1A